MGKKKNYESPLIKRTQVETESGFCAASIIEKGEKQDITIKGHQVGETIDGSVGNEWTDDTWY